MIEQDVEKATSENNDGEKWDLIMEICDKVGNNSSNAKECLRLIMRRLGHTDPHVVVQAITLLDACVSNCGKSFHLEIASREFETEFKKLINKTQSVELTTKLRLCLKRWAENEFKSDPQLNLIPSLYQQLKKEGHDFSEPSKPVKREVVSKDPNVVSSQEEQDDIAKAIELSLKEAKLSSPKTTVTAVTTANTATTSSLYPSINLSSGAVSNPQPEPRKVRALYDFEAAEDNELTFLAGEVLLVLDDTDPNWWKGQNTRGEGLFPANFVSADLSAEPDNYKVAETKKKTVQFEQDQKEEPAQINEDTIDRLLHMLHEADPEDPSQDTDEMLRLENIVNQMAPLIDSELDLVDRKHGQLTHQSACFAEAVNLYNSLMHHGAMHQAAMSMPPFPYHQAQMNVPFNHQFGAGNFSQQNGHGSPMHNPQAAAGQLAASVQNFPTQNFMMPHPQFAPGPFMTQNFPQQFPQAPQQQFNPAQQQPQQHQQPHNSQPQMMYQPPPQQQQQQQQQPVFNNHHQSPNHQAGPQPQFHQTMLPGGTGIPQGGPPPQYSSLTPQVNPNNIPIYQQQR